MVAKRIVIGALLVAVGCGSPRAPVGSGPPIPPMGPASGEGPDPEGRLTVVDAPVTFTVVEGDLTDDPEVEALVAPFRARMGEEIREQIGEATGILTEALPEGTLGNFATDAMLWAANQEVGDSVHMALTNNGGLRIPIGPGPITVGQMYELMPFENMLSVLVFSGSQVKALCHELARRRGAPIAGFSFRIETSGGQRLARDIRVGGAPLDLQGHYRLVTNDYMANGGDSYDALMAPLNRIDLPVLLRDAFIEFVRFKGVIEPKLEGRITGGIGP